MRRERMPEPMRCHRLVHSRRRRRLDRPLYPASAHTDTRTQSPSTPATTLPPPRPAPPPDTRNTPAPPTRPPRADAVAFALGNAPGSNPAPPQAARPSGKCFFDRSRAFAVSAAACGDCHMNRPWCGVSTQTRIRFGFPSVDLCGATIPSAWQDAWSEQVSGP